LGFLVLILLGMEIVALSRRSSRSRPSTGKKGSSKFTGKKKN
jgi:hypothetical protein